MWIVHTEYLPHVHLHIIIDYNPSIHTTTAQPHATILQIGTEAVYLDNNHTTKDTTAEVTINSSEHVLGHPTETKEDITGVVHANSIQTLLHTTLAMTLHTDDPPLIEAHLPIHEITADHALGQPIGQLIKPYIRIHPIPEDSMEIHTIGGIQESP